MVFFFRLLFRKKRDGDDDGDDGRSTQGGASPRRRSNTGNDAADIEANKGNAGNNGNNNNNDMNESMRSDALNTSDRRKPSLMSRLVAPMVYLALSAVYLCTGAAILSTIEAPHEQKKTGRVRQFTFGSCIYFFIITSTTVGYGDVVPYSGRGKFFASVWSIFGLGGIAVVVSWVANTVKAKIAKHRAKLILKRQALAEAEGAELSFLLKHYSFLASVGLFLTLMFVGAAIFWATEKLYNPNYDYRVMDFQLSNSIWFMFASLTTVGYGDLTVTTSIGKVLLPMFLLVTLGVVSLVIADISEKANMFSNMAVRKAQSIAAKLSGDLAVEELNRRRKEEEEMSDAARIKRLEDIGDTPETRERVLVLLRANSWGFDSITDLGNLFQQIEAIRDRPRESEEELAYIDKYIMYTMREMLGRLESSRNNSSNGNGNSSNISISRENSGFITPNKKPGDNNPELGSSTGGKAKPAAAAVDASDRGITAIPQLIPVNSSSQASDKDGSKDTDTASAAKAAW